MSGKLYGVIYADPPWSYTDATPNRAIENHYPTMADEEIYAMAIPAAQNCVLYLWATMPKLVEAMTVIERWGFTYKTGASWDKEVAGMGYWWRGQHELLLVAVRGTVSPPPQSLRVSSVIRCRRGRHSRKPDQVRDWIRAWFPDAQRLEMFSRLKVPGWDVFGNQIETDLLSDS